MTMYKLLPSHPVYGESKRILRVDDGASIPFDPDNTDYQEYLRWLDLGNTPEPAEEST
jgi:hypothetical protein